MIICMGENIYPAQLEEVINCHPKVRDCMVTGVPDPSRGESVVAYIIPEGPDLTVKEINGYCVNHNSISTYMCPRYYAFVSELPIIPRAKAARSLKGAGKAGSYGRALTPTVMKLFSKGIIHSANREDTKYTRAGEPL